MKLLDAPRAIRRGMKAAEKAAMLSTSPCHRVGAALFRGNKLISIGFNSTKSHPRSSTLDGMHHAEFACLMGLWKYSIVGSVVFVLRLTRANRKGISKPCPECHKLLEMLGVKKVFYINKAGDVEGMKL